MLSALFLILFFSFCFACITWRRLEHGIFLLFLLLPTYLIRFHIGFVPTTILEVMLLIITGVWIIQKIRRESIFNSQFSIFKQFFNSLILNSRYRLLVIGISLFFLGATISIFTSVNPRAALGEWKAFYVEPTMIFLIITSVASQKNIMERSLKFSIFKKFSTISSISIIISALIFSGFATSLLAIYQHYTGWGVPYDFWEKGQSFRVTAWYGFPNAVGLFLAPLVPLALYEVNTKYAILKKKILNSELRIKNFRQFFHSFILNSQFICSLFLVPCSLTAIAFAKSTGGLVGAAAGIGVLLLLNKKTRWPAILIGLMGLSGLLSMSSVRDELLAQNRSGQIRVAIWKETAQFLRDHPIAGAGLSSYSTKIIPYHTQVHGENIEIFHHPHNIFLTMWVNVGFTGLLGFILILIWFYNIGLSIANGKKIERLKEHDIKNLSIFQSFNLPPYLLASMTALMTTGLVDSPYIKNDLSIFFWTLIALLVIFNQSRLKIENL